MANSGSLSTERMAPARVRASASEYLALAKKLTSVGPASASDATPVISTLPSPTRLPPTCFANSSTRKDRRLLKTSFSLLPIGLGSREAF